MPIVHVLLYATLSLLYSQVLHLKTVGYVAVEQPLAGAASCNQKER